MEDALNPTKILKLNDKEVPVLENALKNISDEEITKELKDVLLTLGFAVLNRSGISCEVTEHILWIMRDKVSWKESEHSLTLLDSIYDLLLAYAYDNGIKKLSVEVDDGREERSPRKRKNKGSARS